MTLADVLKEYGALEKERQALRAQLQAIALGDCAECERPVTGLDDYCIGDVRGERSVIHASCIGCETSLPLAGCSACREKTS